MVQKKVKFRLVCQFRSNNGSMWIKCPVKIFQPIENSSDAFMFLIITIIIIIIIIIIISRQRAILMKMVILKEAQAEALFS